MFLYSVHKCDKIPPKWMNMLWAFVVTHTTCISPILPLISPQEILKLNIFEVQCEKERVTETERMLDVLYLTCVFFSCLDYEYIERKGSILLFTVSIA